MNHPIPRRAWLALPLLAVLSPLPLSAATPAGPDAALRTQLAFDALYIPALFLTGSAGKSADGPDKARQAMRRLLRQWPDQRRALVALHPRERTWLAALAAVDRPLREAQALVDQGRWPASHEALEQVRATLFEARQAMAADYALDRFTAFHAVMEQIDAARSVDRAVLRGQFSAARALWRRIETQDFGTAAFGLAPAQAAQLNQALAQEGAALSRLSRALDGGDDAEVLQAAGAIKPPFIRAYLAFGAPL